MRRSDEVRRAQRRHSAALRRRPFVIGTASGPQLTGGRPTGDLAVKVYVERKVPDLPATDAVPRFVDGVPTDVVETGPARALAASGVRIGSGGRVGFPGSAGGTIATVCFDVRTGRPLLLSNHHVLVMAPGTRLRNRVLELPGGQEAGRLARAVSLRPGSGNRVDAAVARLGPRAAFEAPARGPAIEAELSQRVRKNGGTTGLTEGHVRDLHADIVVEVRGRPLRFTDQLVLDLAAAPGDSGSLVVADGGPVGLLFAGTDAFVLANPLGAVLAGLRIRLP